MKIVLLNTSDSKGGAAVACKRLARALQKQGQEVSLLVCEKTANDDFVTAIISGPFKRLTGQLNFLLERLQIFVVNRFSRQNLFAVSTASTGFKLINHPLIKDADVIHIHWINQGFLTVREVAKLNSLGKPVFWTMHDLWPVTGICHYAGQCTHYTHECGLCPLLSHPRPTDLSHQVFQLKKQLFTNKRIHFVGCSEWIKCQAEISCLGEGNVFSSIPNPIDTSQYCPGDKLAARRYFSLPTSKKLILFGAQIATNKRKGLDYLISATQLLADLSEQVELVFFGEIKTGFSSTLGLKAHSLGYVSKPEDVVKMYQASDCFVIPSLEENLPNMVMEAMACGVPCVGFKTGGIPEMIIHKQTGYLADYQSAEDLAKGIRFVLAKSDDLSFRDTIREFILTHYDEPLIAARYLSLYQEALENKGS
ncbi:MAG: glycosyltransferase [Bacteroidota bacterium]|nr:glycosyltransferase [Bacteroidota bacterium]